MRKELADWREREAVRTTNYTDQLKKLQHELLHNMQELKGDVKIMKTKVRTALNQQDPAWREKQSEGR